MDFYCLQETHTSDATQHLWQKEWGAPFYTSNGLQNARGVAILIKKALPHKILRQAKDTDGRILLLDVEIGDTTYTIGSVYAPTQDKPQLQASFLDELERLLDTMTSENLIIGGDLNCLLCPSLDKNSQNPVPISSSIFRGRILGMLEERLLLDLWRVRQPRARGYTFRRGSYMSRLDYLLVSNHLSDAVSEVRIHQGPHSDHSLLSLAMGHPSKDKGPGLWRFDPILLTDTKFIAKMSEFLTEWESPAELSDPTVIWEWLKFKIKGVVLDYQKKTKSDTAQLIQNLQSQLDELTEELRNNPAPPDTLEPQLNSIQRELKEIEEEKANRAIFRSRCKWARLGEKPNKYFLNLEKVRQRDRMLPMMAPLYQIKERYWNNAGSFTSNFIQNKLTVLRPSIRCGRNSTKWTVQSSQTLAGTNLRLYSLLKS